MAEELNANRLPRTDSIEELARFWDAHDVTDFDDQLEEVEGSVFARASVVAVQLEPEEFATVRRMARARGMAQSDLIHQWVTEKVHARGLGPPHEESQKQTLPTDRASRGC